MSDCRGRSGKTGCCKIKKVIIDVIEGATGATGATGFMLMESLRRGMTVQVFRVLRHSTVLFMQ